MKTSEQINQITRNIKNNRVCLSNELMRDAVWLYAPFTQRVSRFIIATVNALIPNSRISFPKEELYAFLSKARDGQQYSSKDLPVRCHRALTELATTPVLLSRNGSITPLLMLKSINWTNTPIVTIEFSEGFMPHITELTANFSQYDLLDITHYQQAYSIRLFEALVARWKQAHKPNNISYTYDLYELRSIVGAVKYNPMDNNISYKYTRPRDFIHKALEPAINAINSNPYSNIMITGAKITRKTITLDIRRRLSFKETVACYYDTS